LCCNMRIALDWTPNVNHIGFYVARAKGLIPASVELLSPCADNYNSTPAKEVLAGRADLCVAPTETAIAYASPQSASAGPLKPQLVAVAALLQRDTSAIAVLASSSVTRPSALDGARYASYNARYEGSIVRALVQADGGKGELVEYYPPKLDCFEQVLGGQAAATWIFNHHEGVQAAQRGIALCTFAMGDYGIPYGYSPLLLATPELLASRAPELQALLAGVAQGYAFAAAHPAEAAELLRENSAHQALNDAAFVRDSAAAAAPYFCNPATGAWGGMDKGVWEAFLGFLAAKGLLQGRDGVVLPAELTPRVEDLFTNAFLPAKA
jgi:ABC-type nitrate/sulfonate/bicarbonate transport system substrate-binding protein